MRKKLLVGALCAAAATMSIGLAGASSAQAYDRFPCTPDGRQNLSWAGYTINEQWWKCPLSGTNIPVHARPNPYSPVIGTLPGGTYRFVFEVKGFRYNRGSYTNIYWASTRIGNGWGWVPETYFRGGLNDEDDRGLLFPGTLTCSGTCGPLPPWRAPVF